jgi:hypothetical protein
LEFLKASIADLITLFLPNILLLCLELLYLTRYRRKKDVEIRAFDGSKVTDAMFACVCKVPNLPGEFICPNVHIPDRLQQRNV